MENKILKQAREHVIKDQIKIYGTEGYKNSYLESIGLKGSDIIDEKQKDFEELFDKYYSYIYKYEIGYLKDFDEKEKAPWKKKDFKYQLEEEGMAIKVNQGY